jgi:surfactin family lipopeptide synthetase A
MVEHRSVVAFLHAFEQTAPASGTIHGVSVCPFGFDVSVWEFFSALCFGGTLHILLPETVADAQRFAGYLRDQQISSAYIPPALLTGVIDVLERSAAPVALQRMLVGVEPIKQSVLQRFRRLLPQAHIVNGYGPTETTICGTFYSFQSAIEAEQRTPIGAAVPGYRVYLVDRQLQPVPIGVPGELYIGGAGLARGYRNRPDLTAELFVPNPFDPQGGARLYKTGDLARYRHDGQLEFLGRADQQIKLRGFRIELGEIEAQLATHPDIRECVLLLREDRPGDKRLVAYVVEEPRNRWPAGRTSEHSENVGAALRAHLKERLPEYMLPSAFVILDTLPKTPNGKLDRRALPVPDTTQATSGVEWVAPRTATEQTLAAIWHDVLGVERVGVHDDFFDLGGHSLKATQIISRIHDALHVDLPIRSLFEARTIDQLAALIDRQAGTSDQQAQRPGAASLEPIPAYSAAEIDQLSEAEIESLLLQMLPKEDVDS